VVNTPSPTQVGLVWNFVGSTAGVLVLYIYPSAFYLRLRYVRYRERARKTGASPLTQYTIYSVIKEGVAWLILVIGLVLLVVENYQAIYAVIEARQGSSSNSTDTCASNSDDPKPGSCYTIHCPNTSSTADDMFVY
jgi:heme/copper-type cytochrome/quinol oxidase subunit 2